MGKSKEIVWYDWAGPSGYEENAHMGAYRAVPVAEAVKATATEKRRKVMASKCCCSSRVAVGV